MDTVDDVDAVVPSRQSIGEGLLGSYQDPVELLEVGEGRLPHPHDQVLVDEAVVGGVQWIQQVHRLLPVWGTGCACGLVRWIQSTAVCSQERPNG